mgnify:CR=1 FL=1
MYGRTRTCHGTLKIRTNLNLIDVKYTLLTFDDVQGLIDQSQKRVSGDVKLRLYKGNVIIEGRRSEHSLYSEDLSTFESDSGAYDQRDAEGFIKINALRLKTQKKL